MLRAIVKIAVSLLYAIIILIGVTFAVKNRARLEIDLFPLPYIISVPTYLFTLIAFAAGALLGWITTACGAFENWKKQKNTSKRIAALEDELITLRTEQLVKIPPQP